MINEKTLITVLVELKKIAKTLPEEHRQIMEHEIDNNRYEYLVGMLKMYEIMNLKVIERIECDECRKNIPNNEYYYEVVTSHSDWGRDSVDSVEIFNMCCDKCLNKKVGEYLINKSNTKEIDIVKKINI